MGAKLRHWKEKDGRFWARIAVPKDVQPVLGKTELIEALGGDRRLAVRNHPAAVARLQDLIAQARLPLTLGAPAAPVYQVRLTAETIDRSAWHHYTAILAGYEQKRSTCPTEVEIEAEYDQVMRSLPADTDEIGHINALSTHTLMTRAQHDDSNIRSRRLNALRAEFATSGTRVIDPSVAEFVAAENLAIPHGSRDWHALAKALTRAEIQALQLTLERDGGDYSGQPTDPLIKAPVASEAKYNAIPLLTLFNDYVTSRQAVGKHMGGANRWQGSINSLIDFLGHSDARKITKRNLLDWRDKLLVSKSAKTVADVDLACLRAVLRWAFENDRLPTNEAEAVRQQSPKKILNREKGYTSDEAIKVLQAAVNYLPAHAANPSNRESEHITSAKRWVPLLCAFSGARVTEMTQLRKEDLRQVGDCWVIRITPDAGSVKTAKYRDVPLHQQVVDLGFVDFVHSSGSGPLFHGAKVPEKYKMAARTTSGRLSEWLNEVGVVPEGIQPNHGWRHRFKTQCRELGLSERVADAIQGHEGRTAGDDYGDITITARQRLVDALPAYDLKNT